MSELDDLFVECGDAGVIFRPKDGRLRPLLTKGRPSDALLVRIKQYKGEILRFFDFIRAWADGIEEEEAPPLVGSFGPEDSSSVLTTRCSKQTD